MRLPKAVRVLLGAVALLALYLGVFMWGAPPEFSGAEVGDSMECEDDLCQVIDVDYRQFEGDVEFSDLPRTVLFEGTEAEALEFTHQKHVEATRPTAIGFVVGAVVLGGLALLPGKRKPQSAD